MGLVLHVFSNVVPLVCVQLVFFLLVKVNGHLFAESACLYCQMRVCPHSKPVHLQGSRAEGDALEHVIMGSTREMEQRFQNTDKSAYTNENEKLVAKG